MAKRTVKRSILGLSVTLAASLFAAVPASANGPCGQDSNGNAACSVNSPGSYNGTLTTNNERDYYVFYMGRESELAISITDTENPECFPAPWPVECGGVGVSLLNAEGEEIERSQESTIVSGITVPKILSHTLQAAGTYYLVVLGGLGRNAQENPTPVPYTLAVNASPAVQWPPPPPPLPPPPLPPPPPPPPPPSCVVPGFSNHVSLATIERRIRAAHCRVGHVTHTRSRRVHRGDVVALSPGPHRHLANLTPVNIRISYP